jgi:hypothetical protein
MLIDEPVEGVEIAVLGAPEELRIAVWAGLGRLRNGVTYQSRRF